MNEIKGISPISNQPFGVREKAAYSWIKDEKQFDELYKELDIFDYSILKQDFIAFKKENPILI